MRRWRPGFFRSFYARRAFRILPASLVVLGILHFVAPLVFSPIETAKFLADEPYLWTWTINLRAFVTGRLGGDETAHFWSLACEEQFYLLWPIVVAALPMNRLRTLCLALIPGAMLLRIALLAAGVSPVAVHPFLFSRVDSLAAGALVAILAREGSLERFRQPALRIGMAASAAFCAGVVLFRNVSPIGAFMQSAGYSLLSVTFGCLLVRALTVPSGSPLRGLLQWTPIRTLGFLSYGVYLVHLPLRPIVESAVLATSLPFVAKRLLAVGLAIVLSTLLAAVSWRLVEKPALALRDRIVPPLR